MMNRHRSPRSVILKRLGVLLLTGVAWAQTPHARKPAKKTAPHSTSVRGLAKRNPATATHHTVPGKLQAHASGKATLHRAAEERIVESPSSLTATLTEPEPNAFLNAKELNPFFQALAALEATPKTADTDPTVRILQFGDSHTAADIFTGAMRAQLQARFGDGGLGFQFPGHPFAGYHLAGSSRAQDAGWFTEGNKLTQLGDGDLGLGGISLSTSRPSQAVTLSTTCTNMQIEYLRQPGGGRIRFTDNERIISDIDTNSTPSTTADADTTANTTTSAGTMAYACTSGTHDFQLTTLDNAPVKLLGLVTEQPGITYECLGINGAVAPLILRWNQQIFADYLRQRSPDLIVLAYGTNEASQSAAHNEEYASDFDRLIETLHRVVPSAAVLVLGPYDRAIRSGRGRHATWQTFYGIDRIIADQKAACRQYHCAFYDERERMGGPGAMQHWAAAGLAQADHTHLTGTGYRDLAQALYLDLMGAYKQYQKAHGSSEDRPSTSVTSNQPR